ncbi:MAG: hypothetical protein ACK6BG_14120 [Cyanobacteriota bacterium]
MGFGLASVAVMGNDALQTLGPFLASQRGRGGRWRQGLALAAVLCVVLLLSWRAGAGDPAWGRLDRFPLPDPFRPRDLLPLGALLLLTRLGLPVSTSFLVLTALAPARLGAMVRKSLAGYGVAFAVAAVAYGLWSPWLEGRPAEVPPAEVPPAEGEEEEAVPGGPDGWMRLQWLATLALWSQWLVQDLANIYVYLPRRLSLPELLATLVVLCGAVALIVALGGGPMQERLRSKSGVNDPRATAVISLLYGLVLLVFLGGDRLPLSTSWLFLGLLAGREVGLAGRGAGQSLPLVVLELCGVLLVEAAGLAKILAVAPDR